MKTHTLKTLAIVFLTIIQYETAEAQTYSWKTVTIGGGGATISMKAHPRVKDLYFITTDVGNPYRWNKQTRSWEGLLNMIPASEWNVGACANLAFDPNDKTGNMLYATVGKYANNRKEKVGRPNGKVIFSKDRGTTWKDAGLSIGVSANQDQAAGERLVVDPVNSDIVYVTTYADGTWKGIKKGTSWQRINELNGMFIAFDEKGGKSGQATRNILIGCNDGVYMSDDAGKTFHRMEGSPAQVKRAAYDHAGNIYVTSASGVFKWSNNKWTDISPAKGVFRAIDINPNNGLEVITSPSEGHVPEFYITKDGGRSWSIVSKQADFSEIPFAERSHFSLSTFDFCWDPFDSKSVWFTDFFNAYKTNDVWAPQTVWKACARGHEEIVTLGVLVCPPLGINELLSCTADLGGFDHPSVKEPPPVSMYKFFPWTPPNNLSGNMTGVAIQENSPGFIARVGRRGWDGVGLGGYSTDGGVTYKQWVCPDKATGGRIAVSAATGTMIWASQDGGTYRSTDSGRHWQLLASVPLSIVGPGNSFIYINPLVADKVNSKRFYLYKAGKLYSSYDEGLSFSITPAVLPVLSNTGFMKVETSPGAEGDLWLSMEAEGLYHSTDGGNSFQKIENVQYSKLMSVGKAAKGIPAVYVLGKVNNIADGVFRSDDNGRSWTQIDVPAIKMGMEPNSMAADRIKWGKVFIGTNGNGIFVGEPTFSSKQEISSNKN